MEIGNLTQVRAAGVRCYGGKAVWLGTVSEERRSYRPACPAPDAWDESCARTSLQTFDSEEKKLSSKDFLYLIFRYTSEPPAWGLLVKERQARSPQHQKV
ncbi:hypothetical protein FRC12_004413 [Ceratobasidium sp. 428]|nr:hypothetical protein FRC12_004413 [Ceratobasidium sp. 428]